MSKSTSIDYFHKCLIVFSRTTAIISIPSFAIVIGAPVGIASASLSFAFSKVTGTVTKFFKTTRDKKKKHNKIVILTRSKLNNMKCKISEALINN